MLAHLTDIRSEDIVDEDGDPEGFRIVFVFAENPFLTDKELSVSFLVTEEGGYVQVRDIEGCDIHWRGDKDVTVKKMKKKPKAGSKAKPLVKMEPVESFFRWFSPPEVPQGEEEENEEEMEMAQEAVEHHMAVGELLREQIIPHAVDWFTGAAAEELLDEDDEDDEEEYGSEDEDEDDDEDEESDDEEGGEGGEGAPKDSKDPAECKQQ